MQQSPLTVGVKEAAAIIGVGASTYRRWAAAGVVPKPMPGTKRIRRADVESYLCEFGKQKSVVILGDRPHIDDSIEARLKKLRESRNVRRATAL